MTSVLLLSRLRTLLDEAEEGFWTDDECYAALSDAQREAVNNIFARNPFNENLKTLIKTVDGTNVTNQAIALPTAFKDIVTGELAVLTGGTKYPCKVIDYNKDFIDDKNNDYLKPIAASPVVYVKASTVVGRKIYFEPTGANTDYSLLIITNPTEITASINPILPEATHEALIYWAFQFLLRKDLRVEEANGALALFTEMIGKL